MCGLCHDSIQQRLLSETDLTYKKAMEIATAMEAADKNNKAFKPPEASVKKLSNRSTNQQSCYHCECTNHMASDCKFKDAECHKCGEKGHIAPACRSKTQPPKPSQQKQKKRHNKTHHVQDDTSTPDTDESSGEEYHLHKLGAHSSHPIEVQVLVNDQRLGVDTGAAISIISDTTRKAKLPHLKLHKSNVILLRNQ